MIDVCNEAAPLNNDPALLIVGSAPTPLLLVDENLIVLAASAPFYDILDCCADAVLGRNIHALDAGNWDTPQVRSLIASASQEPRSQCEIEIERSDNDVRRLAITARKFETQRFPQTQLLVAVADITEARAATRERLVHLREKAALLKELQRQRALIDELCETMGVSLTCAHGNLSLTGLADETVANPRLAAILGLIVTELVMKALAQSYPEFEPGAVTLGYQPDAAGWRLCVRAAQRSTTPHESLPKIGTGAF